MPQVIRPQNVTVQSRDGELSIRLTIDLNLNLNGQVSSVMASASELPEQVVQKQQKPKDEAEWLVPEFGPSTETIEFGKYEK
jgi:hypothetical protein